MSSGLKKLVFWHYIPFCPGREPEDDAVRGGDGDQSPAGHLIASRARDPRQVDEIDPDVPPAIRITRRRAERLWGRAFVADLAADLREDEAWRQLPLAERDRISRAAERLQCAAES